MGTRSVRKVYLDADSGGGSTEYWEQAWAGSELAPVLGRLNPSAGPIWQMLTEHVARSGPVLEAGCGAGLVLAYLRKIGCNGLGVDLAGDALRKAKAQLPDLPLVEGDVARLPFADATFGCIVSMGVVEHFEDGPLPALREHQRVLRPGGRLLISVPRLSPLKRWNDLREITMARRDDHVVRGRVVTRVPSVGITESRWTFHQYEFPRRAFRSFLVEAGFSVLWIRPILVSAGIGESRLVQRLAGRGQGEKEATPGSDEHAAAPATSAPPAGGALASLRQAALREQGSGRLGSAVTRMSQEVFGHMDWACATVE